MQEKLIHLENDAYSPFSSVFSIPLNEHAAPKTRILRYNNKTYITEELRKEIMKRSKIGANIKFNVITVSNSYIKQKKQHYKNLDIKEGQTIKSCGKVSNLTLAKVTQIQRKSCC